MARRVRSLDAEALEELAVLDRLAPTAERLGAKADAAKMRKRIAVLERRVRGER